MDCKHAATSACCRVRSAGLVATVLWSRHSSGRTETYPTGSTHAQLRRASTSPEGSGGAGRREYWGQHVSETANDMVLIVTATYVGAVGYGDVYDCQIRKVVTGDILEPRIRVSVLAGDREKSRFFADHPSPAEIEIGFVMARKNEPYHMAPISGFVDRAKTSWQITSMRKV